MTTSTVTTLMDEPLLAATLVSTTGLVMRGALVELRWWLALRGTGAQCQGG